MYKRLFSSSKSYAEEPKFFKRTDVKIRNGFQFVLSPRHNDYVNSICCTTGGDKDAWNYIVSASDDQRLLVWKVSQGEIIFHGALGEVNEGHKNVITSVCAISKSEILSASYDCVIKRWDVEKLEDMNKDIIDYEKGNHILAILYVEVDNKQLIIKGSRLADKPEKGLINCYCDNKMFLLKGHTDYVRCFCVTSKTTKENETKYLFTGSLDKTIRKWDLGACLKIFAIHSSKNIDRECCILNNDKVFTGHTDWVRCVCLSKDDLMLISGSTDKTIRIWDIESGECIQKLEGHTGGVRCLCISNDGAQIISGSEDKSLRIWDLQTGSPIRILLGHENWVTSLCTLPNTRLIVSCSSDKTVRVWDVYNSPLLKNFGHKDTDRDSVNVLAVFSYDEGTKAVTATNDEVLFWATDLRDPTSKVEKIKLNGTDVPKKYVISCLSVPDNCEFIAIGLRFESEKDIPARIPLPPSMLVLKTADKSWLTLTGHTMSVTCICVHEYLIISGSLDMQIFIWKYVGGTTKHVGCCSTKLGNNNGTAPNALCCMKCSDCERHIIISGLANKVVMLWTYDHQSFFSSPVPFCVLRGHNYPVQSVTVTLDGKQLLSGSDDYTIKIWDIPKCDSDNLDIEDFEEKKSYEICYDGHRRSITFDNKKPKPLKYVASLEGHTRAVMSLCCTEIFIISGSSDKKIMIWSLQQRIRLRTLIGHDQDITSVHVTKNNRLLSTSKDGTMKMWDITVGCNLPSDDELRESIRVWHDEHGLCQEVTSIVDFMTSHISTPDGIAQVPYKSIGPLSDRKTEAPDMLKTLPGMVKAFEVKKNPKKNSNSESRNGRKDEKPRKYYKIRNIYKRAEPDFRIRYQEPDIRIRYQEAEYESSDGVELEDVNTEEKDEGELMSLVHWMSESPHYRGHMLDNLLLKHPDILYSFNNNETLLRKALKSHDPNFIYRILKALSSYIKKTPVMWHANYAVTSEEKSEPLLVDIEDVSCALDEIWCIDAIKNGLLKLQPALDSIQQEIMNLDIYNWDNDGEEDKLVVGGAENIFLVDNWKNFGLSRGKILDVNLQSGKNLKHASYVPFPMRVCKKNPLQHSSSRLLESCVDGCAKYDDSSVFESDVLTAILTHKLNTFGWNAFYWKFISCFTLVFNFGCYCTLHNGRKHNMWWSVFLSIHFLPVIILELIPSIIGFGYCLDSNKSIITRDFILLLLLNVFGINFVIWVCYLYPDSELDNILSAIVFFILFLCAVNTMRCIASIGLYVRMLVQVILRMRLYPFLIVIYLYGFGTTFFILLLSLMRSYLENCIPDSGDEQCDELHSTTKRFQTLDVSWLTMYFTMMGVGDWESNAFKHGPIRTSIVLTILFCGFVYLSNVLLNITISTMSEIYNKMVRMEHANCHYEQAKFVLGIERLFLYFQWIDLKDNKVFPRWLLVLTPKKYVPTENEISNE